MSNQGGIKNYASAASRGRASVGAMQMDRSPIRGGGASALVKPGEQKEYQKRMRNMSNKKNVEKSMK